MSYVVFNFETSRLYKKKGAFLPARYATAAAAKAAVTRLKKSDPENDYDWASLEEYNASIEKTHLVRNLMTGDLVEESINTPWNCSVASESYWCS